MRACVRARACVHTYTLTYRRAAPSCRKFRRALWRRRGLFEAEKRESSVGWGRCALSSSRGRSRTSDSPDAAR
eukprot:3803180-Alexandrium_andersonii.AAC.1